MTPLKNAQRLAALFRRESRTQERHRERHHQRGAGALHRARGDQPADVARQGAGGRRRDEQAEADREHAPSPEAVAKRGARQQQHRKAQVIGVDRPLERFDRRAEVEPDRAQRSGDDHARPARP